MYNITQAYVCFIMMPMLVQMFEFNFGLLTAWFEKIDMDAWSGCCVTYEIHSSSYQSLSTLQLGVVGPSG